MKTSLTTETDAEALLLGLGMFATGGGGLASRGRGYLRSLAEDGVDVSWSTVDDLSPDDLTCSVYGMGSIAPRSPMGADERASLGISGERNPRPWLRAVDSLEAHLGEPIAAIVPFELGPSNTLVALDAAARSGRTLVDGDYIGRALPEMSQALPAILGLPTWPLTICDRWGNALVMTDCPSPAIAERVGKMVSRVTKSIDPAASCSHAAFPLRVSEMTGALIPGTLTQCLEVGRTILEARKSGREAVEVATRAVGGTLLFAGTVSVREWDDSADGYMDGTTTVTGSGRWQDASARVWYRNEHHVVWVDDRAVATSPDIIAVIDSDDAEPISNTELKPGRAVSIVGIPARAPFRTGLPLQVTEPRHYGIDLDYLPLSGGTEE